MRKIAVYAICKNECKFIERWIESVREADYIVVLDTGSTDDTIDTFKKYDNVIFKSMEINPWRFDVARNEALNMVPEDTDIFVSIDLDEIFESGWAEQLRNHWMDTTVRAIYKYAWSHNEDETPGRIFRYDKIHGKGYHWEFPVHEMLVNDSILEQDERINTIDVFDYVYLHHYPDYTKSRSSYLPLLELRKKESPDDYYGLFYLSHEYHYRGMYEKSNEELQNILDNYSDKYSPLEIAGIYLFMGDNYRALGDNDKAITNYNLSINSDSKFREPYLLMAEIYNEKQMYNVAIGLVEEAFKKCVRQYNWLERDTSWNEQPYDILAIAYYYLYDIKRSYSYSLLALSMNPYDERLKSNNELIKNKFEEAKNEKII